MSGYGHGFEPRFKLEEAKFFFKKMESTLRKFKDESSMTKFLYFLDAFLAAARNVTFVFKGEFKNNTELMKLYDKKVRKWQNDKVMKLFIIMRNITTKEHTPETLALFDRHGKLDLSKATVAISPDSRVKQIRIPLLKSSPENLQKSQTQFLNPDVTVYFYALPKWFDGNPDVMFLCKHHLNELEEFVNEVEEIMKVDRKEQS